MTVVGNSVYQLFFFAATHFLLYNMYSYVCGGVLSSIISLEMCWKPTKVQSNFVINKTERVYLVICLLFVPNLYDWCKQSYGVIMDINEVWANLIM